MTERPRIYLVSPPVIDPRTFPGLLAEVLDGIEVACLRLALAGDEDRIVKAADASLPVARERDVATVLDDHRRLAERLGFDGVHLTDGARSVRAARGELGKDAIVGAFCGSSRHDGISAGEAGADYVSFGPVRDDGLGGGAVAGADIFSWWSEMIELPVVAEGGLDAEAAAELAPVTDFLAVGGGFWENDDALDALRRVLAPIL